MKKFLLSVITISVLKLYTMQASEENNGGFIGVNVGGMISGQMNGGVKFDSSVAVGLRGGYQAFFYDNVGARFYISGISSFGLLTANGNGMVINLNVLTDLNADMLFDFVSDDCFTSGVYLGFFGGSLITSPIKTIAGNGNKKTTLATTVGLNIGTRTTAGIHHEFDIGAKLGAAFNIGDATSVGAAFYIGSSYSYKF